MAWLVRTLFFAVVLALGLADDDATVEENIQTSITETTKLKQTVTEALSKSVEEVKTLKALLTSNAKATQAMNVLLLEMEELASRTQLFHGNMEACRKELNELEAQAEKVVTPEEANELPSLLQLTQHAEHLAAQAKPSRMLVNASLSSDSGSASLQSQAMALGDVKLHVQNPIARMRGRQL